MTLPQKTATIFGGTGFIGRQVVRVLADAGYTVKVATRVPERAYFLRPYGTPGQIVPVLCALRNEESVAAAMRGADVVVNCIGVLYQRRRGDFYRLHADAPARMAQTATRAGVSHFVHLSALGAGRAKSRYARTKQDGERGVLENFPGAVILRPSVVFGSGDGFFTFFAVLARAFPVLPLVGGGHTKFQPVYVGDVAAAVLAAIRRADAPGRVYELGGPEVITLKQAWQFVFSCTGRPRALCPLPFALARVKAWFLQWVPPRPLLTPDQVETLKVDNVVDAQAPGLRDLGVVPTGMALIVPAYLARFRPGGRQPRKRQAA